MAQQAAEKIAEAQKNLREGRLDQAEKLYRSLRKRHADLPQPAAGLASVAQARRSWDLAASRWRECVSAFSSAARPWWYAALSNCLLSAAQREEAERAIGEFAARFPDDALLHCASARLAHSKGDTDAALQYWDRAVERAGDAVQPLWLVSRASLLQELRRDDAAEAAYREITTRFPDVPAGWRGLGSLAFRRKAWSEAVSCFDKAIALAGDAVTPWMLYQRATALLRLGKIDEAESQSAVLRGRFGENHLGHCITAMVAMEKEQWAKARARWKTAFAKFSGAMPAWTYAQYANSAIETGENEVAVGVCTDLAKSVSGDVHRLARLLGPLFSISSKPESRLAVLRALTTKLPGVAPYLASREAALAQQLQDSPSSADVAPVPAAAQARQARADRRSRKTRSKSDQGTRAAAAVGKSKEATSPAKALHAKADSKARKRPVAAKSKAGRSAAKNPSRLRRKK